MLVRAGLPDSVGRRLAAALDNVERSGAHAQQLSETTAKNTLAALPRADALQPGVAAYYKEIKLLP